MKVLPVRGAPFNCLRCAAELDAASHAGDLPDVLPEDQRTTLEWIDGSVSVCAYCQHVAVYVVDRGQITLRPVRRDEWPSVWAALGAAVPDLVDDLRAVNLPPP